MALGEIEQLRAHLAACREIAEASVPKSALDRLWADFWNHLPPDDQLYVIRAASEDRSAGGIIIPETAKAPQSHGWVLVVGREVFSNPSHMRWFTDPLSLVGQGVYWSNYAGTPLAKSSMDAKFDADVQQISISEVLGLRVHPRIT